MHGLALNHYPPNIYLLSSLDYRCELYRLADFFFLLFILKQFLTYRNFERVT
jgi:hypothetical protein